MTLIVFPLKSIFYVKFHKTFFKIRLCFIDLTILFLQQGQINVTIFSKQKGFVSHVTMMYIYNIQYVHLSY